MADEIHIASLVAHARPERLAEVSREIGSLCGACVHATAPNGKMVVTLEAGSGDAVLAAVNAIQKIDGVLTAALVYQYADSREAMMEELPHDH